MVALSFLMNESEQKWPHERDIKATEVTRRLKKGQSKVNNQLKKSSEIGADWSVSKAHITYIYKIDRNARILTIFISISI